MAARILVFENDAERMEMCAGYQHNWAHQPRLFGSETEKLLELCNKLFHADLQYDKEKVEKLKGKIFGIAKVHHVRIK